MLTLGIALSQPFWRDVGTGSAAGKSVHRLRAISILGV
jgi:hypothetical protein